MTVVLTAWFPQNRIGFLVGLALWGGICAFTATKVADEEANAVLGSIPEEMRAALTAGHATLWIADPIALRRRCEAAIRALIRASLGNCTGVNRRLAGGWRYFIPWSD
jgi:hypothetical protein